MRLLYLAVSFALLAAASAPAQPEPKPEPPKKEPAPRRDALPVDDPDWLFETLERVRERYSVPAISAAVVIDGRVVAASAAGRRKADDPTPVRRDDRFVIGSVSKPVTATLIGVLAEKGVLSFDDTLEKMFPELKDQMQPEYRQATVAQLLAHTSGLPFSPAKEESHERFPDLADAVKNRYEYVRNALSDRPAGKPGEKFVYSGGAIIAAHHAERLTKKPVEELLEEHVYRPLGWAGADHLTTASGPDAVDGPWNHARVDGRLAIKPPIGERGQSRLTVGGVCCTMTDLARWAGSHLPPPKGPPYPGTRLLKPETLKRLHEPQPPGESTMTFYRSGADWAKGVVLWHSGSNGGMHCVVHLDPDEGYATCVAVNCDGEGADLACDAAHRELVKRVHRLREKAAAGRFGLPADRGQPGGGGFDGRGKNERSIPGPKRP